MRITPGKPLSEEDTIALGDDAARLLGDEMFNNLLDITEDRILREWVGSDSPQERENKWATMKGLQEMQKTLEILAARAKEIRRKRTTRDGGK